MSTATIKVRYDGLREASPGERRRRFCKESSRVAGTEFEDSEGLVEAIDTEEGAAILGMSTGEVGAGLTDEPQIITAWVTVFAPIYDVRATQWRFTFGSAHESMDISETFIAADAIGRGGAMIDDAYRVRLEIRQAHAANGVIRNIYRIKEVLELRPARARFHAAASVQPASVIGPVS